MPENEPITTPVTTDTPPAEQRPAPPTKSFSELAREPAGTPPIAAAEPKPFDYNEWRKTVPKEAQERLDRLEKTEADAFATGEYLRPVIPALLNPKVIERLQKLVVEDKLDERAVDYVLGTGIDVYEKQYRAPGAPEAGEPGAAAHAAEQGAPKVLVDRLNKVEKALAERGEAEATDKYVRDRQTEWIATAREIPELAGSVGDNPDELSVARARHIINHAEEMSRRTGKRYSYKDAAEDWKKTLPGTPPPAVPNLSPSGIPSIQHEIKNAREGADKAKADLAKIGGFARLARVRSN